MYTMCRQYECATSDTVNQSGLAQMRIYCTAPEAQAPSETGAKPPGTFVIRLAELFSIYYINMHLIDAQGWHHSYSYICRRPLMRF